MRILNLSYPFYQKNQNLYSLNDNNRINLVFQNRTFSNIRLLFEYQRANRGHIYHLQDVDNEKNSYIIHDYDGVRYLYNITFNDFSFIRSPDFNPIHGCYLENSGGYLYGLSDTSIRIPFSDNRFDGLVYYYFLRPNGNSYGFIEYGIGEDNINRFAHKIVAGNNFTAVAEPRSINGRVRIRNMNIPLNQDPIEFFENNDNSFWITVIDESLFGNDISYIRDNLFISSRKNIYQLINSNKSETLILMNNWDDEREILNLYGDSSLGLFYSYYLNNETYLTGYNYNGSIKIADGKYFFQFHAYIVNNLRYLIWATNVINFILLPSNLNLNNIEIFSNNLLEPHKNNNKSYINNIQIKNINIEKFIELKSTKKIISFNKENLKKPYNKKIF